jgi:hypothetical protein
MLYSVSLFSNFDQKCKIKQYFFSFPFPQFSGTALLRVDFLSVRNTDLQITFRERAKGGYLTKQKWCRATKLGKADQQFKTKTE